MLNSKVPGEMNEEFMALLCNGQCYVNKSLSTPRDSMQVQVGKSTSVISVPYRDVQWMRDCAQEHHQCIISYTTEVKATSDN